MQSLVLVLHVLAAIAIIALVLLQQGRGAEMGASFGSGASNTMFGSASALPFLVKVTAICAAIFFITSITLSNLAAHRAHSEVKVLQMPEAPTTAPVKTNTNNSDADAGISFAPTVKK
ncbi:MAG: preprotein translocase subunit SecG [Coxiellaceae bacterium]|nr:preprotein translocase subunit SecG [Coxiellaceae bacterium]